MLLHMLLPVIYFVIDFKIVLCGSKKVTPCGSEVTGLFGRVTSPDYPSVYPNKLNCKWTITVPNGYILKLTFTEFELEWSGSCSYDYVEVKASNGTFGKYCGARPNSKSKQIGDVNHAPSLKPLFSPDNKLEIFLSTDFSNEDPVRGFDAHFVAIDVNECSTDNGGCEHKCHNFLGGSYCSCRIGYKLRDDKKTCSVQCRFMFEQKSEGIIQSPEYPNEYPALATCEWHIVAEKGYFVHIEFLEFEIENHENAVCPYDFVYLEDENRKVGPYCGKNKPKKYKSYSNWLIVEFITDASKGSKGFKAKFWLEAIKCRKLRPPYNGKLVGAKKFIVNEVIEYECDHGYKLSFDKKRKCKTNGHWSGKRPNCTRVYCAETYNLPRNGYGTEMANGQYHVGSKIDVRCDWFHDLFGTQVMECKQDGTWSGGDAFCVKTCGRTSRDNRRMETCSQGTHREQSDSLFQPWLIAILYKGDILCSGMLISNQWALTSTHCIKDMEERYGRPGHLKVILGAQDYKNYKSQFGAEVRKVKQCVVGRRFDYAFHTDIALIKLDKPVALTKYIQPICLPELKSQKSFFRAEKPVVTIGWVRPRPESTSKATQRCEKLAPKSVCKKHVKKTHIELHMGLHESPDGRRDLMPTELTCTNATFGSSDACKILPGSGLISFDQRTKKWYLGGILSWGTLSFTECKKYVREYPVYTKVFKYISWVLENTKLKDLRYPDVDDPRIENK